MSVGIIMLVHTALDRAEQVARHWSAAGCPVVIHVDANVPRKTFKAFSKALEDVPTVRFCRRHECEWGTWGLVAGTLSAAEMMLAEFDAVHGAQLHAEHRMLSGGAGSVSDVAVPVVAERTVLRESLYQLIGLQFVQGGTETFANAINIPYSYRDTTAAGSTCATATA